MSSPRRTRPQPLDDDLQPLLEEHERINREHDDHVRAIHHHIDRIVDQLADDDDFIGGEIWNDASDSAVDSAEELSP
jgi:hypothetical protein